MIPQVITDISGVSISGAGQTLANNLIARLESAYPAFAGSWRIIINEPGGVLEVTNLRLSGRWGFVMHIAKVDPEGRKVVRAAGELLERYRVSRSPIVSVALESLAEAPRNRIGDYVADHG